METDDPEVGFYYENGIEIAHRGKKDSGKPYHHFYRDGAVVSYHDNGIKKEEIFHADGKKRAPGEFGTGKEF